MSITSVIPFYRNRMEMLGFKEWEDAFNTEDIPSTILDKSFHIEVNPTTAGVTNQLVLNVSMPVTIKVFRKGFRDTAIGRDTALLDVQNIICDILLPSVRLGSEIKNVIFDGFSVNALADSNDNVVMTELNFSNNLIQDIR